MAKKRNKKSEAITPRMESPEGMRFLYATNPKAAVNLADKETSKKKTKGRPNYPREIDKNPRSKG